MSIQEIAFEAKHLCRQQHSGVLSTHSVSVEGYPFGSVVPFFMTPQGNVIIYISEIALHTRNIKGNPKVSLTIFDGSEDDSQANARVTILGDAHRIDDAQIAEQYYRLFPRARGYLQTHDFHFYQIDTVRVRYIGGFGRIHWIDKAIWQQAKQEWHSQPEGMLSHMNDDHQDAMVAILAAHHGIQPEHVVMQSVFPEGAHYQVNEEIYYVAFEAECESAMDVRKALVSLTNQARSQLAQAS